MFRPAVLGAAVAAWGCGSTPTVGPDSPGSLAVDWAGSQRGSFVAAAQASWCRPDSMVEILAVRGDTGVGVALFVQDTLRPTSHPVFAPDVRVDWRPLATVALRWFTAADLVGFESTSGVVGVTAVDGGASGTLDVRLKSAGGLDTLHLTGRFTAVPIEPARGECGRLWKRGGI